jgi:hypothetical protein
MSQIAGKIAGVLGARYTVSELGEGAVVARGGCVCCVIAVIAVRDGAVFVNTGRVDGVEERFENADDAVEWVEDAVCML